MKTLAPIWLALALCAVDTNASTFVGNGGSDGEVELLVSVKQLRETFTAIANKSEQKPMLCECNKMYNGRTTCEPLAALNDEQKAFCNQTLYKVAPAVLKLLDARNTIHFRWTNDTIEVADAGKSRDADAVADPARREIVINLPRFKAKTAADRVYLLSHELMHFIELDGKQLSDKGAIGPFAGEDGSRDFINSMASAAAVMQGAYPKEISANKAKLYRSQAQKPIWFTLDFGGGSPAGKYDSNFQFNSYSRAQASFRYQFHHNFGVMAAYRHEWAEGSVLDTIKTSDKLNIISVGPTFRIFMSDDPLSFWGQSHLMVHTLLEVVRDNYEYHEDVAGAPYQLREEGTTTVLGGNVGVSYYMPLFVGFWTYVGVNYEYHPYKYSQPNLDLKFDKNLISGNVGVGYAF